MKQLITTIAAVLLVGCGESQQSAPAEVEPAEPVAVAAKPEAPPEPPTAKAPDISINEAAERGFIETVKQHLDAGTDVNAKNDPYGEMTPLHLAASQGQKEVVELLIEKGADMNAKLEGGTTPLDVAIIQNQTETADLFRKHGGKTAEELKAEGK